MVVSARSPRSCTPTGALTGRGEKKPVDELSSPPMSPPPDDRDEPDQRELMDPWGRTQWSVVNAAGDESSADLDELWRQFVERYHAPVRQSVRRALRGRPGWEEDAGDFFTYVFEKRVLAKADPAKGRFRCFMQGVIRNWAASQKREAGGKGYEPPALDIPSEDEVSHAEAEEESAWALHAFRTAIARTGELPGSQPRNAEIVLRLFGVPPYERTEREALRAELGLTENAFNVAAFRGREVLRDLVLEEIRSTTETPDDFENEKVVMIARLIEAHPDIFGADGEEEDGAPPDG